MRAMNAGQFANELEKLNKQIRESMRAARYALAVAEKLDYMGQVRTLNQTKRDLIKKWKAKN